MSPKVVKLYFLIAFKILMYFIGLLVFFNCAKVKHVVVFVHPKLFRILCVLLISPIFPPLTLFILYHSQKAISGKKEKFVENLGLPVASFKCS